MLILRDVPLMAGAVGGGPDSGQAREPAAGGFSHDFEPGRITVVLGRNRSGKSRLCRLIAGLDQPAGGSIVLDGRDVTADPPGRRNVALVYQAFVNYPNLSVFDNIASPLKARRLPAAQVRRRVEEIAAMLKIDGLLERQPAALSGGQQQRLAIGRALAKSAKVLLLDEPLVNLDYKLREALEFELRTMLRAERLTVVYATSDPRDAFNLGDEVILLHQGRKLQAGTPLAVYERPDGLAAAGLMSDPGINWIERADGVYAVRPEHLVLDRPDPLAREFLLKVLSVETNGSDTYLHGIVEQHHWVAKLHGLHRIEAGQSVCLYAPRDAVLRFSPESLSVVPTAMAGGEAPIG